MGNSGAGDGAGTVRVLVDNGEYWLRNRGDIAMMVMTVERLRDRWPQARIGMLTDEPRILRGVLPQAEPVVAHSGGRWGSGGFAGMLDAQAGIHLIGPAALRWRAVTEVPKHYLRGVKNWARREVHQIATGESESELTGMPDLPPVPTALAESDLVIAQGGGYMTDVDLYQAHRTLNLLEAAQRQGIPNVMIGQGLGPMRDAELLRRCAEVLPGVDLIALREGLRGPKLLAELGVPEDKILVTGDDAVEFAYRLRRPEIGTDLGLCLRISDYSKVTDSARDTLGAVVRREAAQLDTALAPLIISEYDDEDRRHTLPLLAGAARTRPVISRAGTAQDVARQVSRCRVLVTSAYHLAVFALSQGIPAVAVTASQYYDDKFYGLADMFDTDTGAAGLRIVHLDVDNLDAELTRAIRQLWESAPELRDTLQQKAVEQIDAGRAGLDRVYGLVAGGEGLPGDIAEPVQGE
ncbi:polysaccharide pyruvyl transferase family protein [Nocardia sp. CDC160]|uniref:polysaccharide pyruvyl transferase family protein n=1 Tax=Nocardia sp. CDC160 TaxID=3112166 RepID=UPI002DBECBF1|nr:polysaccharide pyruvyl transferase family protein [Nocardia sp. CDC160]MEC3918651.1 polysaccharide pyruvyl transferase family protein [Nocardia sp. CDC160]